MPLVKGGIEGEFQGRIYPCVIGLKEGPRTLHFLGEGTTWNRETPGWIIVTEPNGSGGVNRVEIPLENVAFIAQPMFVIEPETK